VGAEARVVDCSEDAQVIPVAEAEAVVADDPIPFQLRPLFESAVGSPFVYRLKHIVVEIEIFPLICRDCVPALVLRPLQHQQILAP
jgi:hypothetical protein